jgi:hypothetical protein
LALYHFSGNHERDWPGTGSFYGNSDSGGECGVLAETMFYVPAENRANFWYGKFFRTNFNIINLECVMIILTCNLVQTSLMVNKEEKNCGFFGFFLSGICYSEVFS